MPWHRAQVTWKIVGWTLVVVVVLVLALAGVGYYFPNLLTTPADRLP